MAIDIDAFLERHKNDPTVTPAKDKENKSKSSPKSLDFQKDVEDNITEVEKEGKQSGNLSTLQEVFDEIKRFEEDLPEKFLSIDQRGAKALQEIGNRYSENILQQNQQYLKEKKEKIEQHLSSARGQLNAQQYLEALKELVRAKRLYHSIPLNFATQKTSQGEQIFQLQCEVYEELEKNKKNLLASIKEHLKSQIIAVNTALQQENVEEIEQQIEQTQSFIDQLPLYFHGMLTKELSISSHILSKAEVQLRETAEYLFREREDEIHRLYEYCKKSIYNQKVNEALNTYDQMVAAFEALPDYDLERKTRIYEQLNEIYGSLNNLLISQNISMFLEAYNGSKIIEEVASYLRKVQRTKKVDPENIEILKEKLETVPDSTSRKQELMKQITRIQDHISKFSATPMRKRKVQEQNKSSVSPSQEVPHYPVPQQNNTLQNQTTQPQKIVDEDTRHDQALKGKINAMYQALIKTKDKEDQEEIREKLHYFVRFLSISEEERNTLHEAIDRAVR